MIRFHASLFLTFCLSTLFAQVDYKQMMNDPQYNFYEVVEAADQYFSLNETGKGSGYIGYLRWKHENEPRYFPSGIRQGVSVYRAAEAFASLNPMQQYLYKGRFDQGWIDRGPYDADNITSHYSAGIGRVEDFYVSPLDTNIMYMASRSGGFWRTINGGSTWLNTTDQLVASGVGAISVSPTNSDSVLIDVRNANNSISYGIYRSVNGGQNWIETDFNVQNVGKGGLSGVYFVIYTIKYHPSIPNLIFIGTSSGLYRSSDNLATWATVNGGAITDIEFHPTNPNIVYAFNNSSRSTIRRSTNAGLSFSNSSVISGNNARGYLAVNPQNPRLVYFASNGGIWKSSDEGINFSYVSLPDESCAGFAVSDLDTNIMLYGSVDIEQSVSEGLDFTQVTSWSQPFSASYVHADVRCMEVQNGVFYVGTDGYFAKSNDNGTTWTKLNNGTGIRENYRLGICQSNFDLAMCGSQDNGTSILTKDHWIEWNGGDGMEALIHPLNGQLMIGSWQYGQRSTTIDGGQSRQGSGNPQFGSGQADWIAPMLLNPLNHMEVYHFGSSIYKGSNFGKEWEAISAPGKGIIQNAAIGQINPDNIVISRLNSIFLSTDGGATYNTITNTATNQYVTYLTFSPKNDNIILATYGSYYKDNSKVFISYNKGQSWINITYNLDNMPVLCAVIDHSDDSYIYIGTELGVYYKALADNSWTPYNASLPAVAVKELEIHQGANMLRAASWGRGVWDYTLVGRENYPSIPYTSISSPPSENSPSEGVEQYVSAVISYEGSLDEVYLMYSVNQSNLDQRIDMQLSHDSTYVSVSPLPCDSIGDLVYFKVFAKSDKNELTETYRFMYEVKEFSYCEASGTAGTTSDYINYVALNNWSYTSGKEGYGDFSSEGVSLTKNETYTLQIGMAYHWEQDTTAAWIDFNGNGQFEATELIQMGQINDQHQSYGRFTVPATAKTGALRMRVRSQYWNNAPNPCGDETGEVEDYTLSIEGSANIIEPGTLISALYPNPSNGQFELIMKQNFNAIAVNVFDMQGRLVITRQFKNSSLLMLDEKLLNGSYIVAIEADGKTEYHRLIIK